MSDNDMPRVYTITWNDLAMWKAKGMQVMTVTPGEGAETTILAIMPAELANELAKRSPKKRAKKASLKDILADLAGWAALRPGEPRRMKLTGGLGIDLMWGIDGMWRLQIWREGTIPSLKEWETCLKAWPEPVPADVTYKRFSHDKKQYMRSEWQVTIGQENNLPGRVAADEKPGDRIESAHSGAADSGISLPEEPGE